MKEWFEQKKSRSAEERELCRFWLCKYVVIILSIRNTQQKLKKEENEIAKHFQANEVAAVDDGNEQRAALMCICPNIADEWSKI